MTESLQKTPTWTKFVFGGLAGIGATMITHPFDLLKTRMQLSGEGGAKKIYTSSFSALKFIYKNDGFKALYVGLSGGVLRQILYGTTKMGVYNSIYSVRRDYVRKRHQRSMNFIDRLGCGTISGMAGALIGNPSEIVLVRMTSDNRLPVEKRRNYKNAFQALYRITREEGFKAWFKGLNSTILRCVVQNAFQLGSYSQIKVLCLEYGLKDDLFIVPGISSFGAGFIASLMSLPFDTLKTRLQTMKHGEYKNAMDCARKLLQKEGILGFWKGFIPYYLRVGPHTVFTFLFLEELNHIYLKYFSSPTALNWKPRLSFSKP